MIKCRKCKYKYPNSSYEKCKKNKSGRKTICLSCRKHKAAMSEINYCSQRIGCDCGCMNSMSDGLTIAQRIAGYPGSSTYY